MVSQEAPHLLGTGKKKTSVTGGHMEGGETMLHPGGSKATVKTLSLSCVEIPGCAALELRLPLLRKSVSTGTNPWKKPVWKSHGESEPRAKEEV